MKKKAVRALAAFALSVGLASAQSAEYPQTAHVKSAVFTHTTAPSNMRTTRIEIGPLVYVASNICKAAEVGHDYPAKVEGKTVKLLAGDKVCKYRIVGTEEK